MSTFDSWFAADRDVSLETIRRIRDEPPPTPSVASWLYPGSTATIFGEPDAGKSMLAAATAARVVLDGGAVLWVDYEQGERRVIERLLAFGLTDQDIAEHVYRVHYPIGFPNAEFFDEYGGVTLGVFDAFTGLLSAFGGSSNNDVDIETVYATALRPLAATGSSVLSLDHVTKDRENRGRWAIGSQRKIGAPDVAYVFDVVQRFRPGFGGKARLKSSRDRAGGLDVIEFTLDADMEWRLVDASEMATEGRLTGFMERISRFLEGQTEGVSSAAIELAIKGANEHKRKATATLIYEGYVAKESGDRGANLHTSRRPYREAEDSQLATSPDLAASSPRRGTSPPRLPLRSRGEVGEVDTGQKTASENASSPDGNGTPPPLVDALVDVFDATELDADAWFANVIEHDGESPYEDAS